MDDSTQLRQFVEAGSQEAFRELVGRHTDLVYACALQRLRDPQAAEDVTQAVFLALALKARSLRSHTSLAGWLFTTTRYVASRYQRGEQRRKEREMRAFEENQIADAGITADAAWAELEPHLAPALDFLPGADREALLLRFYRKASHREVAAALGTSEDGARMRVDRALDKLRRFFAKKGVAVSATALSGALMGNAAQAAPAGLAATAGATALAGTSGTVTATSTMALAQGAMKAMFIAQAKTAAVATAAAVVVAGSGAIVAQEVAAQKKAADQPAATAAVQPAAPADLAPGVIVPRNLDAWRAFNELGRKGGPQVTALRATRWLLPLRVPAEMLLVPVEGRKLIEAVAATNGLKTAWARDGRRAVLYRGAADAEVERVAKDIGSPDPTVRREAAWRAGWMRDVRAVALLAKATSDADAKTVRQALDSLARLNWDAVAALDVALDTKAIDLLVADARSRDYNRRSQALAALSLVSRDKALVLIEKGLADKTWGYPDAAALGKVGGEPALALIEKALGDSNKDVRKHAMMALGGVGGEKALALLERALGDAEADVRCAAVTALGRLGGERALTLLERALADQNMSVRHSVAGALGEVGGERALALLEKALADKDTNVRSSAARALGNVGGDQALALIEKSLGSPDQNVRSSAALALGDVDGDRALPLIEKALADREKTVASCAVRALANVSNEKALPLIERAYLSTATNDSKDSLGMRRSAIQALEGRTDERAVALVEKALADTGKHVRSQACRAVARIEGEKRLALLDKAFATTEFYVPGFAWNSGEEALGAIERAMASTNAATRQQAVSGLGDVGGEKAQALLKKALADPDVNVQIAAAGALGSEAGDEALLVLEKGLGNQDVKVRSAAIWALSSMGGVKARDILLGRLAVEKDRGMLMQITNRLKANFADDPVAEKALKDFKLPDPPKPEPSKP